MGRSEQELKQLCPAAKVLPGLPIRGSEIAFEMAAVRDWAESIIRLGGSR